MNLKKIFKTIKFRDIIKTLIFCFCLIMDGFIVIKMIGFISSFETLSFNWYVAMICLFYVMVHGMFTWFYNQITEEK